KDIMGNCIYGELNKMPHLLIAGATGSGKSVCVNSIISSILMRAKPDEVKLLLVDPKKVEFTPYKEIPHLLGPVITDGEEANRALKVIVSMMDNRYELFSMAGVRNIAGYNAYLENHSEENLTKLPWIVVIIDELADLMLVAAKEVEGSIQRITQLARAAGIHLIVATQRPSVDVITGVIKANIPSRIAFAVSSAVDSRTILDQMGAEKLLGYGDMLYTPVGETVATRVQGVFVSDEEVQKICDYVTKQGKPKFDDAFLRLALLDGGIGATSSDSSDPLYDEIKDFIIQSRKASTSLIQRKFSIGYARAARLIDTMEEKGIIGPSRGSKPREVFIKGEIDETE
ncbi:MAG: DNA translocase FtsK, partial [Longicatena sp.]